MKTFASALLALCIPMGLSAAPEKDLPPIAVFSEPDFPAYSAPLDLPTPVMLALLAREGIPAKTISAAELADPTLFNADRFCLLIMPTGNAYPQAALKNIVTFRSRGGSLVTSGFPFHTACEHSGNEWKVLPNQRANDHGTGGVGAGGYRILPPERKPALELFNNNAIGFKCDRVVGDQPRIVWLDPLFLPREDRVYPLLTIKDPAGHRQPAAALIQHKCKDCRGALDLWLGAFSPYNDITDRNVTERLFCNGILWFMKEKGLLSQVDFSRHMQSLYSRKPIPEIPTKLRYVEETRPWENSFLPKSSAPARNLLVVNTSPLNPAERIALTCLQGLVAREQPKIWLIRSAFEQQDRQWLELHKAGGHIESWEEVADWSRLFTEFKKAYRGAVVADPALYRGDLIALNVAMCEDLIVTTPELAEKLGLPVTMDLRGRFTTYAEGMRWVWTSYRDKFNRFVCDYMWPGRLKECVFDYALQWRAPLLWVVGPGDASEPGADLTEEYSVVGTILSQMAPQSAVMGFPAQGTLGFGEPTGVQLASRYGRGLVCTNSIANLSVMSGVRLDQLKQTQPAAVPLDKTKVYVSLTLSDGDNLNCWEAGFFKRYFEHPSFPKLPLGFTMGTALRELAPVVANWFFSRATSKTEFVCGVSGATYIAPSHFGTAFTQPTAAWTDFLKWTRAAMNGMEMRTLNISPSGKPFMDMYAKELPFCHSIVYGWTRPPEAKIPAMAYSLSSGMPGFDSAMPPAKPVEEEAAKADPLHRARAFVADLEAIPPKPRPLFLNVIIDNWGHDMNQLEHIMQNAPAEVVFVTPGQLAELYKKATDRLQR